MKFFTAVLMGAAATAQPLNLRMSMEQSTSAPEDFSAFPTSSDDQVSGGPSTWMPTSIDDFSGHPTWVPTSIDDFSGSPTWVPTSGNDFSGPPTWMPTNSNDFSGPPMMTTFAPDMRRKGKGFYKDGFTGMPDFDESTAMPVTEDYQDFTGMPDDVTGQPEVRRKEKVEGSDIEHSTGMPDFDDSTGMPVTEDFQDVTGMPVTEAL